MGKFFAHDWGKEMVVWEDFLSVALFSWEVGIFQDFQWFFLHFLFSGAWWNCGEIGGIVFWVAMAGNFTDNFWIYQRTGRGNLKHSFWPSFSLNSLVFREVQSPDFEGKCKRTNKTKALLKIPIIRIKSSTHSQSNQCKNPPHQISEIQYKRHQDSLTPPQQIK